MVELRLIMLTRAIRALRRPVFAASFLFAGILTATGAFGTFRIVLPLRLLFWMLVTASAAMALLAMSRAVRSGSQPEWRRGTVIVAAAAVPTTLVASAAAALLLPGPMPLRRAFELYPATLILNALLLALLRLTAKRDVIVEIAPTAPRDDTVPQAIAAKLPPRLTRSRLVLVEAQDHYLRVATRDGDALVQMRFADALAVLEESDGTRVHRSWWVARPAIEAMKFDSGRGELTLFDGSLVPVSRRFAPQAKDLARRPKP